MIFGMCEPASLIMLLWRITERSINQCLLALILIRACKKKMRLFLEGNLFLAALLDPVGRLNR